MKTLKSIFIILLLAVLSSCSAFKKTTYSAKELEYSLTQNCAHPIIKEAKYGILPIKVQFLFDNPTVKISHLDNKIYFIYHLKLDGLGLSLQCNECVFSTVPKINNGQVNFSDNFALDRVDCFGGPDWLKSVFSKPQELIINLFAGNSYEIIQCASKNLPKNAGKAFINQHDELTIED